ncbi:dihydroxyacetone kinase subunit DhaK [Amycolatopsis viridis]|uniref:Dihydroxyacetone kinase-like protein n=1 Tax=Amycolatopsis viridis TaxID=185678 RepID=A0ABX0SSC0_9PSEU|nr:dihydroxyacetone kinase subunit DhaK [Amycolatopsis viridis]NIH79856.1 dihydroxyacetone kinase-like protein [Amycolatopsis viridis]
MAVRQLVNDPDDFVREALEGLQRVHPDLIRYHEHPAYVIRAQQSDKVALVSGGGSGHEPLHTGFVGTGMLDAAVPGAVFASPTAYQVRRAISAADRGRGVLLIVKNYTGDVLNFRIAAELAAEDGIQVRTVLVDDDLATDGQEDGAPGRRGTAAVVAVEKICGAAAENGASLDEVAALGERVVSSARTMALALAPCTQPGHDKPSFDLPDGEIEFGVGIHGEHGIGRRPYAPVRELVADLTKPIVAALGLDRGDQVIAIVNGLGSTHGLELSVVHRELSVFLEDLGVRVGRALVGSYVTALDMRGCSITLLRADEELLALWDSPVATPALTW